MTITLKTAPKLFGMVLAAVLSLSLCERSARAADETHTLSVRLDWLATGYQAPFFLAAEKGWFKKAGLDVTIQQGNGSSCVPMALRSPSSVACMRVTWPAENITIAASST